jgi:hypothetical protein
MKFKSILSILAAMVFLCSTTHLAAKSEPVDNGYYTTKDKGFYLTAEQVNFVRPGLELEILEVTIPADRQLEVKFRLTDPAGLGLDRDGITTPGPVSTSFILSYIPAFEESYVAYTTRVQTSPETGDSATQGSTDSGGSYTDLGDGTYMYKFATVLPEDYDTDATHTLGIYARRDLTEFDLDRYVANELDHFVPSGSSAARPRDIVKTETCNGRCHDPLALHGGSRQEVGLCILCHNSTQDIDPDTGNSVDFPLMIHKIHAGVELANGYTIIGYRQGVHDYSDVVFPAGINECELCHTGGTPTENFPMVANPAAALVCDSSGNGKIDLTWQHTGNVEIQTRSANNPDGKVFARGGKTGTVSTGKWVKDGTLFDIYDVNSMDLLQTVPVNATVLGCAGNAPGTFRGEAGVQHTNWLDHPSRKTCGSCHDHVDFATGEGHSEFGIIQPDDNGCGNCHEPDSGDEFDRSITGAHKALYKSTQFPGVLVKFIDVTNTNPGDNPTVTFSLGSKSAKLNPASLNRLRLAINGPNDDFDVYIQETVGSNAIVAGDNWTYTFEAPLPEDATGSYTVSVEGRNEVSIDFGDEVVEEEDQIENTLMAFAVTDSVAEPRRMVVDDYKCESCHSNLSLHGDNRKNANYCVTCHMPDASDEAVRPLDQFPEQSIHFKFMIHKIHRGAELENGFVVYGFRGSLHDFSDIEFTGDLRNCDACHVNDSEQLPLPAGLLPTATPQLWWDPTMPTAAACLSCHDGDDAASHAFVNTSFFGESCSTCHGEGKEFSVDKVHAQ